MLSCHGLFSPTSCSITTMLIDDTECILHYIVTAEYLKIFIKYMPNINGEMFADDDSLIFFVTDSSIFILHKYFCINRMT